MYLATRMAICMLPGGVLAIAACESTGGQATIKFVAARNDSDPQALAVHRASTLAGRRFGWLTGMARTNDGLLACSMRTPSAALYKFATKLDSGSIVQAGSILATVPALADYGLGVKKCAVHQQTQRTYAVSVSETDEGSQALVILDANLQAIATVEATTGDFSEDFDDEEEENGPICDVAVHGDQVIVLTSDRHAEGSGLRLLDLDATRPRVQCESLVRSMRSPGRSILSCGRQRGTGVYIHHWTKCLR